MKTPAASRLLDHWRDKVRAAIPVDHLPRPVREQCRESVVNQIESCLERYFFGVDYGLNESRPAPKSIADRATKVKETANALAVDLQNIRQPKDQGDRKLLGDVITRLRERDIKLADLHKWVSDLEEILADVAIANDRPNPNRRPPKDADRMLTRCLTNIWIQTYGKQPTCTNFPDGTQGGAFFELLKVIEGMVGSGYSAGGQMKWYDKHKAQWRTGVKGKNTR